jgi:predicted methyltransferase
MQDRLHIKEGDLTSLLHSSDKMPTGIALDAAAIAPLSLVTPGSGLQVQIGQTEHRINLVKRWGLRSGDRVLELGCGQGDCTTVLATAVGEQGHVTAIDPASLDYGRPFVQDMMIALIRSSP